MKDSIAFIGLLKLSISSRVHTDKLCCWGFGPLSKIYEFTDIGLFTILSF